MQYGGFAYREADDHNKALYRPITLDCDLDVQPGPEDPFTTKVADSVRRCLCLWIRLHVRNAMPDVGTREPAASHAGG